LDRLLRGGENGIRAAKYAELTKQFLRPSTSVFEGPHVKLLQLYEAKGLEVLEDEVFKTTDYYKNAEECMRLTGAYFYDRPEKIKDLATRFIRQYKGEDLHLPPQPGQSDKGQPIWVRPIKYSSYYEVIDGNHRIAQAIMRGKVSIPALIYEKEPVATPLQQLLLDCLWINKQKWLYQPVNSPEINEQWIPVRRCTDRLKMMHNFLEKMQIQSHNADKTYIDIGSSYGWFVKEMSAKGYKAFGMERDPFGMEIGFQLYGLKREQIIHRDIVLGMEECIKKDTSFNIVSCLSVLHHFVLGKSSTSAEGFIQLLDRITDQVLFIDTGEDTEAAFGEELRGWNPDFIQKWISQHSSFKSVIPLGVDQDRQEPFSGYYNRTLFACIK
jgi:hypothetical protein